MLQVREVVNLDASDPLAQCSFPLPVKLNVAHGSFWGSVHVSSLCFFQC